MADFLRVAFSAPASSPTLRLDLLRWKYFTPHPGWSAPRSFLLESSGAIVAHGAIWPLTLLTAMGRHTAFQFIDWAADSSRPGTGVSILQKTLRLADVVVVPGGTAMAQKILPAVGFKLSAQVRLFARPLRPLAQFAAAPRWNVKTPARLGRNLLRRFLPPLRAPRAWRLESGSPRELAPLLRARSERIAILGGFDRSPELIEYYFDCPIVQSQLCFLSRCDQSMGYCVMTRAGRQARIVDAWVCSDQPEDWRALFLLCGLRALRHPEVCEVATFTTSELAASALRASGFLPRGSTPLKFFSRSGVDLARQPLFMQMLDSDSCYLHEGLPQFWT